MNISWLLANWILSRDNSINGSILVKFKFYSIYFLYHSSVCQLECFKVLNSELDEIHEHIVPGEMLYPGMYIDYKLIENIV
jgi:hypothetical protein